MLAAGKWSDPSPTQATPGAAQCLLRSREIIRCTDHSTWSPNEHPLKQPLYSSHTHRHLPPVGCYSSCWATFAPSCRLSALGEVSGTLCAQPQSPKPKPTKHATDTPHRSLQRPTRWISTERATCTQHTHHVLDTRSPSSREARFRLATASCPARRSALLARLYLSVTYTGDADGVRSRSHTAGRNEKIEDPSDGQLRDLLAQHPTDYWSSDARFSTPYQRRPLLVHAIAKSSP